MFPLVNGHRDRALALRAPPGQCLAISTCLSYQTKPYNYLLFKPHLNHPGQCQVTQASNKIIAIIYRLNCGFFSNEIIMKYCIGRSL